MDNTWSGGASNGNLSDSGNWSEDVVPGVEDNAIFDPASGGAFPPTNGAISCDTITFNDSSGTYGSMTFGGGTYTATAFVNNTDGSAAFQINAGTWNVPFNMDGNQWIVVYGGTINGGVTVGVMGGTAVYTNSVVAASILQSGTFAAGSTIYASTVMLGDNSDPLVFNLILTNDKYLYGTLAFADAEDVRDGVLNGPVTGTLDITADNPDPKPSPSGMGIGI